ncbi:organic cation transporter protein-like isoform X2 [Petromyzon marinus]|uniref:organic cation transporter protein-like isoform X2 n=1 Tax=Petromyzon marinus TaxID=7757 RepID=UPI003F6E4A45
MLIWGEICSVSDIRIIRVTDIPRKPNGTQIHTRMQAILLSPKNNEKQLRSNSTLNKWKVMGVNLRRIFPWYSQGRTSRPKFNALRSLYGVNPLLDQCLPMQCRSCVCACASISVFPACASRCLDAPLHVRVRARVCPCHPCRWQWDLVCTRSYLNNVGSSIFMLGLMVGAPVLGTMADKYGRKSVILVSMAIQTAFGLGAAFAPNFVMYALARFMVGVAISGVIMNAFVLATEWTGIGERMLAGIATQQAFGVGYMLLAPVAYFIRDWRQLQLAISIPEILFIAYIWLLPRSARWLLANNQHDKAESLVRRAAEINGMSLPDDLLKSEMVKQKLAASPQQAHSVLDLFRTPRLRKQSLILFYSWFAITLVYYGLSLGISDLGLDIFLTQFIFGAVEIPARFLLLATLPKSRRMSQVGFLAFGGLFCILTVTVPSDMSTVRTGLAMLGKFGVTASFVVIFIYTAEIYPTVIRQMGVGMSSMFARFGGVLAPLVSLAFPPGHAGPMAMFGAMSLLAAALTLALPETANRPLPDSIADTERDDGEEEEQRQSEGGRRV